MNDQAYMELLAAIARFDIECVSTPDDARQILQEEGFLDESGRVTETYIEAVKTVS